MTAAELWTAAAIALAVAGGGSLLPSTETWAVAANTTFYNSAGQVVGHSDKYGTCLGSCPSPKSKAKKEMGKNGTPDQNKGGSGGSGSKGGDGGGQQPAESYNGSETGGTNNPPNNPDQNPSMGAGGLGRNPVGNGEGRTASFHAGDRPSIDAPQGGMGTRPHDRDGNPMSHHHGHNHH